MDAAFDTLTGMTCTNDFVAVVPVLSTDKGTVMVKSDALAFKELLLRLARAGILPPLIVSG